MRVGILGSTTLNIESEDVYKLAARFVYPNEIDSVVTTNDDGIAATAREIAQNKGLGLRVFDYYKRVVEDCAFVVIVRTSEEFPTYARYCGQKGRPFREYVVSKPKRQE